MVCCIIYSPIILENNILMCYGVAHNMDYGIWTINNGAHLSIINISFERPQTANFSDEFHCKLFTVVIVYIILAFNWQYKIITAVTEKKRPFWRLFQTS